MFAPRLLDFQKTKYARFMNRQVPAHKRYQPTKYEHVANCATHALWIIPSILGSSNLYFLSDDDWEAISAWIYGLGLCGLFVVSTVFHTISWKKSHLRVVERCLHMFDRIVIYFFIAASYAPWLNLRELGPWASHMRWLVWIMASVGTIYVFFFHERYKLVELLCYAVMGFFPALVILSMDAAFPCCWLEPSVVVHEEWPTMFYGTHLIMSPPTKSRLKRQSQLLSSMLSRTLSYKYRDLDATFSSLGTSDDPAELSTQLSAPGVLKVFGDSVCTGTHYKSVLATGTSSAHELVKEALERYSLSPEHASQYVLCDVVGQAGDSGQQWQAKCFRVFGDNEKPLLIQELWKPREGLSRRFELRKRSDVEELSAKDVDTMTAGINAQARRLQRSRAKGTPALAAGGAQSPPASRLRRTVSETSLSPTAAQGPEQPDQDAMRYSLYESPHLLLLQGYSQQHDSLVYLLNRERHTVGQRTPSSKPSVSLSAPDILPLHCTIRRLQPRGREQMGTRLVLEPIPGAPVSVNFSALGGQSVELRHGDLLSLGLYYLLLFKDPEQAQPLPAQALARLRATPQSCRLCGAALQAPGAPTSMRANLPRPLHLEFEPEVEDALLQRIMTLIEPGSGDHQLTPAFLLCLCIQHSATRLEPGAFGQLLLKIAKAIQETVWEKTKELAEKQAHLTPFPWAALPWLAWFQTCSTFFSGCPTRLSFCISSSRSARSTCRAWRTTWMSQAPRNRCSPAPARPARRPWRCWRRPSCVPSSSVSTTSLRRSAVRAGARPPSCLRNFTASCPSTRPPWTSCSSCRSTLRSPPRCWPTSSSSPARCSSISSWTRMSWANLRAAFPALSPAQLHRLLTQYQLASAMGPMSAWEPGVQDSPDAFKSEDVLESYENPPPIVLPSEGFQVDLEAGCLDDSIYQHLLYIRHFLWSLRSKPIPSGGAAQRGCPEGLHHTTPEGHPESQSCPLPSRASSRGACEAGPTCLLPSVGAPRVQGLSVRQPSCMSHGGPQAGSPHVDSSCLLTPPSTPLGLEPIAPDWPEPDSTCGKALLEAGRNGLSGFEGPPLEGDCASPEDDQPPPAPSSGSSSTEDFCYVFLVELERGPSGLGMGLIDGMHTPLGAPGLYIQTLLPGSPAASESRLSPGDRILEVNGSSLLGISYLRAVDLIRHGGKKMRFLIAKSDAETAKKIHFRTPPP
ncbi:ras-associating and dilute domain-containing protein isoform X6 [Manis javanica]|uniref:ras-associating and dilute domain-containing protein isoform X6 n=1 Tax=Manis javanica TaxID=9974 RepID=UPI003C6D0E23